MQNTEEMGRSGQRPEKTLPGSARLGSAEADPAGSAIPVHSSGTEAIARRYAPVGISDGTYLSELWSPPDAAGARTAPVVEAPSSGVRLDAVRHRILEGLVQLRHTDADAMTLVIKPEAGTELSLLVQVRDGHVEVEAQCRRGDCASWVAPWGQLQQSLAAQGIRLGDLEDFTAGDRSNFSGSGGGPQERPDAESVLPLPRRGGSERPSGRGTNLERSRVAAHGGRGWESWA